MESTDPRVGGGGYSASSIGTSTTPLLRNASDPRRASSSGTETLLTQIQPPMNSVLPNTSSDSSVLNFLMNGNNPISMFDSTEKAQQLSTLLTSMNQSANSSSSPVVSSLSSGQQQQQSSSSASSYQPLSTGVQNNASSYNRSDGNSNGASANSSNGHNNSDAHSANSTNGNGNSTSASNNSSSSTNGTNGGSNRIISSQNSSIYKSNYAVQQNQSHPAGTTMATAYGTQLPFQSPEVLDPSSYMMHHTSVYPSHGGPVGGGTPYPYYSPFMVGGDHIYVSNLPSDVTIEKLASYFGEFGQLKMNRHEDPPQPSIQIIYDPVTQQPKGEARVAFETPELAKKAVEYFQGKHWGDHGPILVTLIPPGDYSSLNDQIALDRSVKPGVYYNRGELDYSHDLYRRNYINGGREYFENFGMMPPIGYGHGYDYNRTDYSGYGGSGGYNPGPFGYGSHVMGGGNFIKSGLELSHHSEMATALHPLIPAGSDGSYLGDTGGYHDQAFFSRGIFRGRGGVPREGDWICPKCGNMNFSWRMECKQCRLSRPTHAHVVKSGVGSEPFRNEYVPHVGDWTCKKCSFKNFARRDTCHRCKADKGQSDDTVNVAARDSISKRRSDRRDRPY